MYNLKMHHVGIVVRDIQKAIMDQVVNYGFVQKGDIINVDNQSVKVVLLGNGSYVDVELIEPYDELSPSYNALKNGGGLNHICYLTENFEETLLKFKNKIVRPPMPTPINLFNGKRTFFIHRKHQLIEFLEK